jgi:hypothetical protein
MKKGLFLLQRSFTPTIFHLRLLVILERYLCGNLPFFNQRGNISSSNITLVKINEKEKEENVQEC